MIMIIIPDKLRRPAEVEREELRKQLAEARAEIERLEKAVKVVQSAFNNYKNADAEIAKIEMREAKIEMREARILAASCNPDSLNSERAANAILTDEIEAKDKLIEQMREALKFSLIADEVRQTRNVCASDINDACETSRIKRIAALSAAERGEG